jgi:outer membrane protein, multidrug efflux system
VTRSPALLALVLLGATACTSLAPDLELPEPPVPAEWPLVETTATGGTGEMGDIGGVPVADVGWRDFLVDERLETLVAQALDNNRDLRVAVLSVARSRELYRIRRADRLPSVDAEASALVTRTSGERFEDLTLDIGVTAYELDLFGRIRNLSESALEEFFATEEVRRSVQLSLIAEVARTYLLLAADEQLRDLAEETLRSQEESYRLTEQRHDLGAVSGLDLAQARTTVERSRVDAARFAGEVAQDVNALRLLVGGPLDPALLPETLDDAPTGLQPLPPGLPSEVLLRRPDVRAAEHRLRASNADVGAARAAYFPRVSLTGRAGIASDDLGDLLGATTGAWTFLPRVTVPIFQAGRLRAAARAAEVDRDIAVARYEQAIQIGFREAADALALTATLALQRQAQDALTEAAGRAYELSRARYRQGRDSYLSVLDSQRTFYAAQQAAIDTRLAEQLNRVTLYRVLGGGWLEEVP